MEEIVYHKDSKIRNKTIVVAIIASIVYYYLFVVYFEMVVPFYIFFGVCIMIITSQLRNKKSVVVSEKGITSKIYKLGLVSWKLIDDITILRDGRAVFLKITLHDPDLILADKNQFVKSLMDGRIKKYGTPFIIPAHLFDKPIEVVIEEINQFRKVVENLRN